jgi:hypothetical protein
MRRKWTFLGSSLETSQSKNRVFPHALPYELEEGSRSGRKMPRHRRLIESRSKCSSKEVNEWREEDVVNELKEDVAASLNQ